MTPRPEDAPAAIATQALELRARPSRRQPRHAIRPGNQATSTPTTTDARWGHFKPSRRGQCKPSFSGPPAYDDATAEQVRQLVAKGASGGGVIFETDDCRGTPERLSAAGVEFTQEPTERFYGTDCGLRDPFGNPIRFTQPPEGPIVVPSADELREQP